VDMFVVFDEMKHLMQNPKAVALAIFYHDYIYNPMASNNEDLSAKKMIEDFRGKIGFAIVDVTADLIIATRHSENDKLLGDEKWIVDIDLASMGSDIHIFEKHSRDIREEYHQFSDDLFNQGRVEFLLGFMNRKHIYNTQIMRQRFEAQAVENISRAIRELKNENT
jgi:predicted metal-dependent HD superfamily phosphohydrolase